MNLALFDFDGTITHKDTFTKFIFYSSNAPRKLLITFIFTPIFILYKLRLLSPSLTRRMVSFVIFKGRVEADIRALGQQYSIDVMPELIRGEASDRLAWHKEQGDTIVIVSASLNIYLESWCAMNNYQLICTVLEVEDDKCTGRYVDGDCCHEQKSQRVLKQYDLSDFKRVYAYGDTKEDSALLGLAHEPVYRWRQP